MIYFLASILIPSVIITVVVYMGSTKIINKKMNELVEKNLNSARLIVQERLEFIDELTTLISLNPMVQEVLSESPTNNMVDNVTQIIKLDRALDSYYLSNYYASPNSSIVPTIYLINRPEYKKYDISNKVQEISAIENAPWYRTMGSKNMNIDAQSGNGPVIIAKRLYSLRSADKYDYAALLTVELEKSGINSMLSTFKPSKGSRICILDQDNQVIMSSDSMTGQEEELIQSLHTSAGKFQQVDLDGEPVIISSEKLDKVEWKIVNMTHLNEINSDQNRLTRIVSFVLMSCMSAALLAAFLLSRNISSPITKLVASMRTVRENNFDIDISYDKKDEFGYLIQQYKRMIRQIKDLIDRLYISDLNKQKAELLAKDAQLRTLQAQINPHFLYNTLDSINLSAIKHNTPEISEMINSLANFYRYSLSKGRNMISLDDEITHTHSYLEIQSIRFGPRLRYSIHISRELRKTRIVKLVIQPLVENSIIHGFAQKEGELEIRITAKQEADKIVLSIIDNGTGADVNDLNQLLISSDNQEKSFAIMNVHRRLQSTFGDDFGLRYIRNQSDGIIARITIPANYMGENNVNSSLSR
ncbi:sensor histidine kinase [Paenibacillus sepulcri]|uniref:Sensor histidine kinase n=1 Tax=Paenibacillus sepulcri TaxID=359917 RepID=A0ABS7BY82_9BACL|nr:sensor histidine kinase [Paenibacillus sepulcri]